MRSYPKKSIAFLWAALIFINIHGHVVDILTFFIEINTIYNFVSTYSLIKIINFSAYLFLTLVFYFLADFNFEARTNQVRPEITERSVNGNIN